MFYYFYVSLIIKIFSTLFQFSTTNLLINDSILYANLILYLVGVLGNFNLMRFWKFSVNKSLLIITIFNFTPFIYILRMNMKPEILAFALLPWLIISLEKFKTDDKKIYLFISSLCAYFLFTSKGSILGMTLMFLILYFLVNLKNYKRRDVIFMIFSFLIILFFSNFENNRLGVGNVLNRSPEVQYQNLAEIQILYSIDLERLYKDPMKNYHKDSAIAITLLDTFGDYFELNWKEDSVLFSTNIKPIIVYKDVKNAELNKLFYLDLDKKNIVYNGPQPHYFDFIVNYLGIIFTFIFYLLLIFQLINTESNKLRIFLLAPFIGVGVLFANAYLGFPQLNYDPNTSDTFKVFYYSYLLVIPLCLIINKIKFSSRSLALLIVYILFFAFNLGFPKQNNEDFDKKIVSQVETSITCFMDKNIFEPTFISDQTIDCNNLSKKKINMNLENRNIPFTNNFLFLFLTFLLFLTTSNKFKHKIVKPHQEF